MRLRNIPGADEAIAKSPFVIQTPDQTKGHWADIFGNENPIHIEIGMGKGQFITTLALLHPENNYIGIERYSSVLLRAIQKLESMEKVPSNLRLLCFDAKEITTIFEHGEIDRIYLNFSDPWPKDRHAKRRLTYRDYFKKYDQILSPQGILEFKTDNTDLFGFSLEEVSAAGWRLDACTRDLHKDASLNQGNIMTEYEAKFSSQGNPICKLIASR